LILSGKLFLLPIILFFKQLLVFLGTNGMEMMIDIANSAPFYGLPNYSFIFLIIVLQYIYYYKPDNKEKCLVSHVYQEDKYGVVFIYLALSLWSIVNGISNDLMSPNPILQKQERVRILLSIAKILVFGLIFKYNTSDKLKHRIIHGFFVILLVIISFAFVMIVAKQKMTTSFNYNPTQYCDGITATKEYENCQIDLARGNLKWGERHNTEREKIKNEVMKSLSDRIFLLEISFFIGLFVSIIEWLKPSYLGKMALFILETFFIQLSI